MNDNTLKLICRENDCCACGACLKICPNGCIEFIKDKLGNQIAYRKLSKCLNCNLCQKVCPQIDLVERNQSYLCFASWSKDASIKVNSASGGVATELYYYELNQNGFIVGAEFLKDTTVNLSCTNNKEKVPLFSNSKYTFSNMEMIFQQVECVLGEGYSSTVIGLPCQIAALKKYLIIKRVDISKLLLVDLICHGCASPEYLKNHIANIEKRKKRKAETISFRDPVFSTQSYTFTLKDENGYFYKKQVCGNDEYQVGYHSGIIYRENCYSCKYSSLARVGDLTLADFSGVGRIIRCSYSNNNVSCVLVNTDKGNIRIHKLFENGRIYLESRPIEEEINNEIRLHVPNQVSQERIKFKKCYINSQDFDFAVRNSCRMIIIRNQLINYTHWYRIKTILRKLIPNQVVNRIKSIIKEYG